MIYEFPDIAAPIRQGDIFVGLPRVDISLSQLPVVKENEQVLMPWEDVATQGEPITVVAAVKPVIAIVMNQDCDTLRSRDISLCEIREFKDVERKAQNATKPKAWKNIITQQCRINLKWFYLPPDRRLGFTNKMGVDFMATLRVPREDLERLRSLRKARLNDIADEHFRERLAEFFRRYPYDEWYPLNNEEFSEYRTEYPDAEPFIWQRPANGS